MINIEETKRDYEVLKSLHDLYWALLYSNFKNHLFVESVYKNFMEHQMIAIGYVDLLFKPSKKFITFEKYCKKYFGHKLKTEKL
jgi:hypothetical protein